GRGDVISTPIWLSDAHREFLAADVDLRSGVGLLLDDDREAAFFASLQESVEDSEGARKLLPRNVDSQNSSRRGWGSDGAGSRRSKRFLGTCHQAVGPM